MYSGSVIHAIEVGAEGTPQGRQWYGGIRRFGKADPLIRYMYQARNAEEHGKGKVIAHNATPGFGVINPDTKKLEPIRLLDGSTEEITPDGGLQYKVLETAQPRPRGWNIGIGHVPTGPILVPVYDNRYHETFPPPISHNGKAISDTSPLRIAELFLAYLEKLVSDAESRS